MKIKYKTSCEGCLFKTDWEVLPGIKEQRCRMGGCRIEDGLFATLCPLNILFVEIEKAMKGGGE